MINSAWDIKQKKQLKLLILGHFLPSYPPKNLKNQNFEKWKNLLEISSFDTSALKITIMWCTVPEIQSERDNTFLSFWAISCPFCPDNQENQNFKIEKKTPGDIIILHISAINDNYWCIVPEIWSVWWTEFFVILDHFLSFYPPMDPENQNFDKRKKIPEDIIILQTYMTVIWCMVPQI